MRRIGLGLAVACFAVITLGMRYELAAPGMSQAFKALENARPADGIAAGVIYALAIKVHHIFGLVIWGLIGVAAAKSAQRNQPGLARWIKWALRVTVGVALVSIVISIAPQAPNAGLQPTGTPAWPVLDLLAPGLLAPDLLERDLVVVMDLHLVVLFALTTIAAVLMIAGTAEENWAARAVCLSVVIGVALFFATYFAGEWAILPLSPLSIGMLGVLAFCAFLQSDGDRPGTAYLMIGALFTLAAIALGDLDLGKNRGGLEHTAWRTMQSHLGLVGFSLFVGFAVLDVRWQPTLPRPVVWVHGLGLVGALVWTFGPLRQLGFEGMPQGYFDYPVSFADDNLAASLGSYCLALLVVIGVFMLRRFCASGSGQAGLPTQAVRPAAPSDLGHPPTSVPRLAP